jgi:hypothetical protein
MAMERINEVMKEGFYVDYSTEIAGAGARKNRKFFELQSDAEAFYTKILGRLQNMKEDGLIDAAQVSLVDGVKVSIITYKETVFQLEGMAIQSYHV